MIANAVFLAGAALNFTASGCYIARRAGREAASWPDENALWAAGFGMWALSFALDGQWPLAPFFGFMAAGNLAIWLGRRHSRRRRRTLRELGAKSRARLAALVRRAREAAKPRPVLRPQPGGAP